MMIVLEYVKWLSMFLGYYDNDRFNKWTEYRIKILKLIEK